MGTAQKHPEQRGWEGQAAWEVFPRLFCQRCLPKSETMNGVKDAMPQTISFLFSKTSLNIYLSVTNESTELSHYIQFLKDSNAFALKVTCTEILREKSQGQIRQLVFECINKHFNLESICVKGDIHTVMCPLTFSGSSEIWLFCYQ